MDSQEGKKRVLIVDDVKSTRETLGKALKRKGFMVDAVSMSEAWQRIREGPLPDLIIIDLYAKPFQLRTGVKLIERLRQSGKAKLNTGQIPILIYSVFGHYVKHASVFREKIYPEFPEKLPLKEIENCWKRLQKCGIAPEMIYRKEFKKGKAAFPGVTPEELADIVVQLFSSAR